MYSSVQTYLREALSGILPGPEAHYKMLPPGRRLTTLDSEKPSIKLSSVLVLLFPENGHLYICLTRRPSTMKHHPGQISFPGGKVEKEDISAEITALREAKEEVGIDPSSVEILGKLSDLYVEVSQFSIQPYLAWSDQRPDFKTNLEEVEELILLPVDEYIRNEIIDETEVETISGRLKIKFYPFDNNVIWGATAMILSELIEILKRTNTFQSFDEIKAL